MGEIDILPQQYSGRCKQNSTSFIKDALTLCLSRAYGFDSINSFFILTTSTVRCTEFIATDSALSPGKFNGTKGDFESVGSKGTSQVARPE